ncbi:cytidylate kinase [Lactobacillus colini]|uniref:Cytidylate kinase n=1 Tax=Lactobacillus colini TaxID=1819254 RepID=A0ABS4MCV7_9LACO|nr:hypothetical protein [Lactobacillus colini]MBP2057513.1 cytidylate kinase [Lactobacillus colini]
MYISDEDFKGQLTYLKGLFSLGGLSESGKSAAGLYFDSIGIKRMKIIQVESDMMRERGIEFEDRPKEAEFQKLYSEDHEQLFREFLYRLIAKMKQENVQYASIESLYRAELGAYLKRILADRMINIYIDAPLELRAKRESIKQKDLNLSLAEMIARTKKKDQFKIEHGALEVRDIADIIVNNGENIANLNQYLKIIDGIAKILKKD